MNNISLLPFAVVHKLEEAGIPQDSFIFYQNGEWVYQVGQLISSNDQLRCERMDSLGPFGIHPVDVSLILNSSTFQYTINKIANQELSDQEQATGAYAPIAEITLEGSARSTANIPENATHFCWLYPPQNILNIDEVEYAGYDIKNLLKIGGFAYFNIDETNNNTPRLLRVNSLLVSASNGLIFEGPFSWPKQLTDQLWIQNRFHPVTLPSLREKGARYFAFINPSEVISDETDPSARIQSENGAFVYLFNADHSSHPFDCYFAVADECYGDTSSDYK